jgi:hypothetical protein
VPAMSCASIAGLMEFGDLPSRDKWARRAERAEAWREMEVEPVKPFGPLGGSDEGEGERVWLWP